ncbi:APC family permease [Luteipulveratus halotolerans]|uniref:Amino acid permease n=1 Tax=Luteipulveratus halotolerans TaxID=1631356 RepID=A0A0L6CDN3_9MICO|nr:hypothetical protein [Luteipulveratus halotolerans]KNX35927.1 hypothetical protein VV01_21980 [Luteipulveratus halotolerans]
MPLAFGSIAGSGILSLPSAVYAEAGTASVAVWIISAAACVPMLLMFRDAMALSGDGNAIQQLVTRGIAPWAGSAMPLMFLFVVVVGLPTGCIVAGQYAEDGLGWPRSPTIVAVAILVAALAANLLGGTAGRNVQLGGSAVLVVTGVFLIVTGARHGTHAMHVVPDASAWGSVLPGVLLAFWAFVGFENLTFLGRDLRDPIQDFLPVSIAALAVYGTFALGLTLTIAGTIDRHSVNAVTGLLQISTSPSVQAGVALVGLAAMLINAAAWVRGVDQLIASAVAERQLPRQLARQPLARTALLAGLFSVTIVVLTTNPHLTVGALAASSAVFVMIYLICIAAYVRAVGVRLRTTLNALLVPAMLATLIQSGTRPVYGLAVSVACLTWCYLRRKQPSTTS